MEREWAAGRPGPALRGWVSYQGYDVRGGPAGVHRGLPSPYLTLIVTFDDEPVTMAGRDGALVRRDTVLGGLHDTPVTIVHEGRQAGLHVTLHPLAARRLLGVPAAAIADLDLDACEVLGASGRELHERVAEAGDWAGRFAALENVLTRRLVEPAPAPRAEMRHAWRALLAGHRVGAVAAEIGWSERHLTQSVRAEIGTTPKTLIRMARFDRARHRIAGRATAGAPLELAEVAAAGGFADQAHLTREFRAFTGSSPTRWLAEERELLT